MILRNFPDRTRAGFNPELPCPTGGWPTMIIHATARNVDYPEHLGPLSIKCAFNGIESYRAGRRGFNVDDGSYLVLNEGTRYCSQIHSQTLVESFCVFFNPGFVSEVLGAMITPADRLLADPSIRSNLDVRFMERLYPHDDLLSSMLKRIRGAIIRTPVSQDWVDDQLHLLLEGLLERHRLVIGEISSLPAIRASTRIELYRRLCQTREFIDDNLDQPLSVQMMATTAYLSPHHFLRLFKHLFGETPHQYLTRRRIERAERLLRKTLLSVSEVCYAVGFESVGSFSWLYRRRMGASPEQYRRAVTRRQEIAIMEKG